MNGSMHGITQTRSLCEIAAQPHCVTTSFAHLKQRCGGAVWKKLLVQYGAECISFLLPALLDARADRAARQAPIMPVARDAMHVPLCEQFSHLEVRGFATSFCNVLRLLLLKKRCCDSSCLPVLFSPHVHFGPWYHDPFQLFFFGGLLFLHCLGFLAGIICFVLVWIGLVCVLFCFVLFGWL